MYYNSLKEKLSYWFCFTQYPILLSQQKTPPRCKLFYMRLPIFNHLEAPLVAWVVNSPLQCRRPGFDPWVGKITWRREWLPTPVFLPGEFQGQRSLVSYSPWGFNSKILTWLSNHLLLSTIFYLQKWQFLIAPLNIKSNM